MSQTTIVLRADNSFPNHIDINVVLLSEDGRGRPKRIRLTAVGISGMIRWTATRNDTIDNDFY